jgi:hypothetical protein
MSDPTGEQGRPPDDPTTNPAYRAQTEREEALQGLPIPPVAIPQANATADVDVQPQEFDLAREAVGQLAGRGAQVATSELGPASILIGIAADEGSKVVYDVTTAAAEAGAEVVTEEAERVGGDFHRFVTEGPPNVPSNREEIRERTK